MILWLIGLQHISQQQTTLVQHSTLDLEFKKDIALEVNSLREEIAANHSETDAKLDLILELFNNGDDMNRTRINSLKQPRQLHQQVFPMLVSTPISSAVLNPSSTTMQSVPTGTISGATTTMSFPPPPTALSTLLTPISLAVLFLNFYKHHLFDINVLYSNVELDKKGKEKAIFKKMSRLVTYMKHLMLVDATVVAYPYNASSAEQEQWGITMGSFSVSAQQGVVSFLIRYFGKLPNDICLNNGAPWATLVKLENIPLEKIAHVNGHGIVMIL